MIAYHVALLMAAGVLTHQAVPGQPVPPIEVSPVIVTVPGVAPIVVAVPPAVPASSFIIPKGTIVEIQIDETVTSEASVPGQRFRLRSHSPIGVGGVNLLPSAMPGEGEVVHAARAGRNGRSGELIINARFIDCGGVRVPIGRLKIFTGQDDRTMAAMGVSAIVPLGGLLVKGGSVDVPNGAIGEARVMRDVVLPAPLTLCSDVLSTKE